MKQLLLKTTPVLLILLLILSHVSYGQYRDLIIAGHIEELTPIVTPHKKIVRDGFDHKKLDHVKVEVYEVSKILHTTESHQSGDYSLDINIFPNRKYKIVFSSPGVYSKTYELDTKDLKQGDPIIINKKVVPLHKKIKGVEALFFEEVFEKHFYHVKSDKFHPDDMYDAEFYDHIDEFLLKVEELYPDGKIIYRSK